MNVPVTHTPNAPSGAPECFGKEWSSTEPECTGGPDHSFKDEEGRHVRPRCGSFSICGTVTAAARQALISPQMMIRPQPTSAQQPAFTPQPAGMPPRPAWMPPTMHPPVSPPSVLPDWQRIEQQRQAGLAARPQAPAAPQFQPPYGGQQFGVPGPAHYPAQTWQVGNAMPAYLTHEEVRQPGESYAVALFFSLLRGMGKAAGHTFARYVDVTPIREPPRS
jgi:hypothetical protein